MKWAIAILLPALAACTTVDQGAQEEARFRSFKGMTVSQFMAETLVTPHEQYDSNGQRIFIAEKVAPDPRFSCKMHLETVANGKRGPDGWTIVRTRRQGGCAQV
ncbi:hypothetical protein [Agrobacterium tumefaciens]|uniref:hypothetical protein n=1 Tax=Agrobacterium tumefaciens TaxID=358 RepID=UPI0021D23FFB|nr:hypothetical protein [Agrobacterium tumefaciens]UXS23073.1 hypothetical protein FY153_00895 [Agrobacterium tumefaciens]